MQLKATAAAVAAALSLLVPAQYACAASIKKVEFYGMPAPATNEQKTDIYSSAKLRVTYTDGTSRAYPLAYQELMGTTDLVDGQMVGGLYDHVDAPIDDANGQLASDAPDANSLIKVAGMFGSNPWRNNALALVTQYEYKELPPEGQTGSFWSKLPATMSLAMIDQSKANGTLKVTRYSPVSFADVNGLWIPCAGSLSPWNTHLSSEEYEPDAKVREGGAKAADSDDGTDIASFSQYYFGDAAAANAYDYGLVPEVRVKRDGKASVVKHRALGRFARELADVMPDRRTAYMGDDGKNTGLFMFVADRENDLSKGTLYAGKWQQTSTANGGAANLQWIKLGSASDADIQKMVDDGIQFSDLFDVSLTDPSDATYMKVLTYTGTEWLRLKPGMEKAAAFLETRRYAALLGATTEFSKMEGVTHDERKGAGFNAKAYVVISRVEKGMADTAGDIQLPENQAGAVYELRLRGGRMDSEGNPIPSSYAAATMTSVPGLLGGWFGRDTAGKEIKDAEGNACQQDKLCGPDNIKFSPAMRTLFVGEDTSRRNNNYVWAYNVDTGKLSRILSVPRAAEATGLQVVENLNGYGYIMSNFQHPGDAALLDLLNQKWKDRKRAAIGYIGPLPAFK